MDLNPLALEPSHAYHDIPNTDLSEILKIYGDADVTVSVSRLIVPPVAVGDASTRNDRVQILE